MLTPKHTNRMQFQCTHFERFEPTCVNLERLGAWSIIEHHTIDLDPIFCYKDDKGNIIGIKFDICPTEKILYYWMSENWAKASMSARFRLLLWVARKIRTDYPGEKIKR